MTLTKAKTTIWVLGAITLTLASVLTGQAMRSELTLRRSPVGQPTSNATAPLP